MSAKCWGRNYFGNLGYGDVEDRGDDEGEMGDNLSPVNVGESDSVFQLSVGSKFTCALVGTSLSYEKDIVCWGENSNNQLGVGLIYSSSNGRVGDDSNEMGEYLARIDTGSNFSPISISSGGSHSCSILKQTSSYQGKSSGYHTQNQKIDHQGLKCWGADYHGQLGQEGVGDDVVVGREQQKNPLILLMGDDLPFTHLGSSNQDQVHSITLGKSSSCALIALVNGAKCWGSGFSGILGGFFVFSLLHNQIGSENSHNIGDNPNEMGEYLKFLDFGSGRYISQLVMFHEHACAILDDWSLKCWGKSDFGELGFFFLCFSFNFFFNSSLNLFLGYGDINDRGDDVGEMGDRLEIVNVGENHLGSPLPVIGLMGGIDHTCIFVSSNSHLYDERIPQMKCFGNNQFGQLGYGDKTSRGGRLREMGDALDFASLGNFYLPTTRRELGNENKSKGLYFREESNDTELSRIGDQNTKGQPTPLILIPESITMQPSQSPTFSPTLFEKFSTKKKTNYFLESTLGGAILILGMIGLACILIKENSNKQTKSGF